MPFKSSAQRAWMFIHKPELAKEFAAATPKGAKLPKHVKKKKEDGGFIEFPKGGKVNPQDILPANGDIKSLFNSPLNSLLQDQAVTTAKQQEDLNNKTYISPAKKTTSADLQRRDLLNQKYAQQNGMTTNELGNVQPLFNPNSQGYGLFHKAGDVVGDVAQTAMVLDGAGELRNLLSRGAKASVQDGLFGKVFRKSARTPEEQMFDKWTSDYFAKETGHQGAQDVKNDFLSRLATPEGQNRLDALGRDGKDLNKMRLISQDDTYASYNGRGVSGKPTIQLHPDLPENAIRNTTRHEIEHAVQDKSTTEIDNILSGLELRGEAKPIVPKSGNKVTSVDVANMNDRLKSRQDAIDYFTNGSDGREKSAFAAELQQHLVDNGYINHPYENITPDIVKNAFADHVGSSGYPLRIFNIMRPTENNYNLISKALNKMLVPTGAVATGAALTKKQAGGYTPNISLLRGTGNKPDLWNPAGTPPMNISQWLPQTTEEPMDIPIENRSVDFSTVGQKNIDLNLSNIKMPDPAGHPNIVPQPSQKLNPYFALRGLSTGASWLSGIVDRGRQNQYMMDQFSTMGQNMATPVQNFQPNAYQQYAQFGGSLKKFADGGTLYDYLISTGNSDAAVYGAARKKLAQQAGISNYSGSADQNRMLLNYLQSQTSDDSSRNVVPDRRGTISNVRTEIINPTQPSTVVPRLLSPNSAGRAQSINDVVPRPTVPVKKDNYDPHDRPLVSQQAPHSGVVVDKGQNQGYVIKNGRIVRQFPVITGKNPNGNISPDDDMENLTDEQKTTPVGYYKMSSKAEENNYDFSHLHNNAKKIDPISAYGMQAPVSTNEAIHETYDNKNRDKLYNMPSNSRYFSNGCINCQKPDMDFIQKQFPNSDTLMVMDSRDPRFRNTLPKKPDGGTIDAIPTFATAISAYDKTKGDHNNSAWGSYQESLNAIQRNYGNEAAMQIQKLNSRLQGRGGASIYQALGNISRDATNEKNPYMNTLYSMVRENPDLLDHFTYGFNIPDRELAKHKQGGLAKMADGGYDFLFGSDDKEFEDNTPEQKPGVVATPVDTQNTGDSNAAEQDNLAMQLAMSDSRSARGYENGFNAHDYFGNPSDTSTASSSGGAHTTPSEKGKYAFNYLQQQGLPPHIAAGIVGNLEQESGNFRDDVIKAQGSGVGDFGTAFGIAQWRGQRWTNMLNWAKGSGRNPYTLESQLDYVVHEAHGRGDLAALHNTSTSEEAARLFAQRYEKPKTIDPYRINYAKKYY